MEDGRQVIEAGTERSIKSPGDWLEKVEAIGKVKHISAEVDPNLDASTITYMSGKTVGGPTLLFENIKGHPGYRQLCRQ